MRLGVERANMYRCNKKSNALTTRLLRGLILLILYKCMMSDLCSGGPCACAVRLFRPPPHVTGLHRNAGKF